MIVRASGNTYFMVLEKPYGESEFLAASGVRVGSPGAEYSARMYACLFNALINISKYYEKFYKVEYKDVWQYLEKNYYTDTYRDLNRNDSPKRNTVKRLRAHYSPGMNIFYGDVESGGDHVLGGYIMSDEGFSMVQAIFTRMKRGNLR
jgi:hypothetical protein